jgi:hypothetical protein
VGKQDLNVPGAGKPLLAVARWLCGSLLAAACFSSLADGAAGTIGLNKFDLPRHYIGRLRDGADADDPSYRRVSRALAQKILGDASDVGVKLVRASMVGFAPSEHGARGDLDLWRTNPTRFWERMDEMMSDLESRQLRLVPVLMWNARQFPAMTNETVGDFIRNPSSRSWVLLSRFVTEFVTRYRGRDVVEFYELTNELNALADLDNVGRCSKGNRPAGCNLASNVSTDEIILFTSRYAQLIRQLDGSRKISSGFTIPRPGAQRLRTEARGALPPRKGADTQDDLAKNIEELHRHVDIISVHLYEHPRNKRFGGDELQLLAVLKRISDRLNKPLFVGEFGEPKPEAAKAGSFVPRMMQRMKELGIPYSALWAWQVRNGSYLKPERRPEGFSLEPGYTDLLIEEIRKANNALRPGTQPDKKPPRVVLTWPLGCSMLRESAQVFAAASDDSGAVQRVDFLLQGKVFSSDSTAPYEARLPAIPSGARGKQGLTARAVDAAGNASEFSVDLILDQAGGQPCVAR